MLGSDAAATEQWSVERLLAPGHDAGLSLAACFPIGATSVREVEWTFLGAGGTTVPMVVSGSTIVDPNGDNEGWVLMCTPLAERQQAEQERVEHASLAAQVDLLRSRERQLAALAETTQYVVASRTRREALEVIDHFLPTAFGPSRVRLLRAVGGERTAERDTPDGSVLSTDCWAARTGRAFHSERDHGVRCTHLPSTGRHLCTPLSDGQHLAGILTVDLTTGADHDGLGLVGIESMVDDVASQLSAALANLRLRRALEDQALIDPLTRLGNRRAADRALGDALGRLRSHGEPCAVLMLDIDHFKAINDRHGHDVGDEVLAGFARILGNLVREEDHVARLGGEEFLIVLRDVRREDLDAIVESIRHGIERATFPRGVTTTASIGAVHVADRGVTADEAVAAADALLYEAKRAGRNRAAVGGTDHTPPIGSARIPTPEVTP
jgi:diguanylate cyclase (GGDEF)-like protein